MDSKAETGVFDLISEFSPHCLVIRISPHDDLNPLIAFVQQMRSRKELKGLPFIILIPPELSVELEKELKVSGNYLVTYSSDDLTDYVLRSIESILGV